VVAAAGLGAVVLRPQPGIRPDARMAPELILAGQAD
jgi:hypothetical protein